MNAKTRLDRMRHCSLGFAQDDERGERDGTRSGSGLDGLHAIRVVAEIAGGGEPHEIQRGGEIVPGRANVHVDGPDRAAAMAGRDGGVQVVGLHYDEIAFFSQIGS